MIQNTPVEAFETFCGILKWQALSNASLFPRAPGSPLPLIGSIELEGGKIVWTVDFGRGAPVRLIENETRLANVDVEALVNLAENFVEIANDANDANDERVEFENEIGDAIDTALKNVAKEGISLVSVTSQRIPLNYYQNIPCEVTFAWEAVEGLRTAVRDVSYVEEVPGMIAQLVADRHDASRQQAA